jgi:hypothetical protein
MSDETQKKKVSVYTITETIYVSYQVVATSKKDAVKAYHDLACDQWQEIVSEASSNNCGDEEVEKYEEYDEDEHGQFYDITGNAKAAIRHNNSIKE